MNINFHPGRKASHGRRFNPDPFYQSALWKRTNQAFINSATRLPDGRIVSNRLCYQCFLEGNLVKGTCTDHNIPIKDGGSRTDFSNLRRLCDRHHAQKSAREGNAKRK